MPKVLQLQSAGIKIQTSVCLRLPHLHLPVGARPLPWNARPRPERVEESGSAGRNRIHAQVEVGARWIQRPVASLDQCNIPTLPQQRHRRCCADDSTADHDHIVCVRGHGYWSRRASAGVCPP